MVGLAALTRAEQILLAVVLVVPLCLLCRSVSWRRRFALLLVAASGVVVLIGPWCGIQPARGSGNRCCSAPAWIRPS